MLGLVNVPFWEYWTSPSNICWKLYPQYLGDVQLGHLMTPAMDAPQVILVGISLHIPLQQLQVGEKTAGARRKDDENSHWNWGHAIFS